MKENKSTSFSEVFPNVRANYGAGISEGYGKIISVDNEVATIEWEKEYPDEDALPAWTETVELSSIHEEGWSSNGSSIGIFFI